MRHSKYRHPNQYMQKAINGAPRSQQQVLTEEDLVFEFILNAIRLKQGFTKDSFEQRTFLAFSKIQKKLEQLITDGLLEKQDKHYITTRKGWSFINSISERFL